MSEQTVNNYSLRNRCEKCNFCISKCPDCGSTEFYVSYLPLLGNNQYGDQNRKANCYDGAIEMSCPECDHFSTSIYSPTDCKIFDVFNPSNSIGDERKETEIFETEQDNLVVLNS